MYPFIEDTNLIDLGSDSFISVNKFEDMFGNESEHKFKYDYLINKSSSTKWWEDVFSEWKEKGILN